jgi:16S rRNA (cytosine967-C5)-methyltransferase
VTAGTGRDLARAVLERVERQGAFAGRALSAALDRAPGLAPEERALATELTYGVLRRRARLERALGALASRGLDKLDLGVRIALWVGAYQILFLDRIPAYAAVSEAVEACKRLKGAGVAGLANALLRRLAAGGEPPLPDAGRDPLGYLVEAAGLPPWMARLLLAEQPAADAVAFGDSIGAPAPVALRANTLRATRDAVAARLAAERPGAVLEQSPLAPDALLARRLEGPAATRAWEDGLYAIQDVGAQAVVELLGAAAGERILDACAGNGGKSAHLAALAGNAARIDAVDISPAKLAEAERVFRRMGVRGVTTAAADLTRPLPDATPRYARILLDAPCSGLGVLRRHPEALGRRTAEELPALAARQRAMLVALAPLLLPGGALVYAVCTFERAEAEDVVAAFLADHPAFHLERTLRTWPHRDGADAFFAARMISTSAVC